MSTGGNGQTRFQKMKRSGQPYTEVRPERTYEQVEIEVDGEATTGLRPLEGYRVIGHTLEEQILPGEGDDPEYKLEWQEIDLGLQPTLSEAHQVAADWREGLRGQYEIR